MPVIAVGILQALSPVIACIQPPVALPVAGQHTFFFFFERMRRQCCGGCLAYNSSSNTLHPVFDTATGSTARACVVCVSCVYRARSDRGQQAFSRQPMRARAASIQPSLCRLHCPLCPRARLAAHFIFLGGINPQPIREKERGVAMVLHMDEGQGHRRSASRSCWL